MQVGNAVANVADTSSLSYWRTNNAVLDQYLNVNRVYTLDLLTGLEAGTNANQRIGRKILVKSVLIDVNIWGNLDNAHYDSDPVAYKMLLVVDKQANGTQATGSDIVSLPNGTTGTNGPATDNYQQMDCVMPLISNRQRFVILKEIAGHLKPTVDSANADQTHQKTSKKVRIYKRLNLPVEYGGTTGGIAEIKSNNLLLLFVFAKPNGTGTDGYGAVFGSTRLRYQDS